MTRRGPASSLLLAAVALLVAGCGGSTSGAASASASASGPAPAGSSAPASPSAAGSSAGSSAGAPASGAASSQPPAAGGAVTLVTHDSFAVDKAELAEFEKSSGITVTVLAQGDAGALTNKLVLTKDNPLGDAVFGIDNTFASRALDAGVLAPYTPAAAADGPQRFAVQGGADRLTAVDYGDVCVNVDHDWFTAKHLAEPRTFEDLAEPQYRDLLAVESPATSSPGLAFLLATVAHFGDDGWQQYWTRLKDNGVKVDAGWEDAYTVDFSGSSGKGPRPLVVSYASSPPDEVQAGATTAPTGALLDTCFRQVEYAGVLAGAKNPAGARAVVDFLLSRRFQQGVPEQMYVYPTLAGVPLPADWARFAPVAKNPATMPADRIAADRERWISAWSDVVEG
ncbi:thiamine ABC transporter substrate-binding protein [Nakamurella endophytica]|uniref:Thiamine ABC transporter substrate-binding protein n=1 Tax=Nakamurella endophytica TaxID=1748367 RepID=A0A917WAQ6_9ACTN|nr:thiamine ABC transporter substrate-binding protein [Nakamurella endophytica]GGL86532.1 thiamine ABC transporter substrate-binding protein [Nakamurella endophytica]